MIRSNITKGLADLNQDVQLSILENLDEFDLLSVAQMNKYFSSLAAYVFKWKYSNKIVKIIDPDAEVKRDASDHKTIYLQTPVKILKFLEHFGQAILNLHLAYNVYEKEHPLAGLVSFINKQVNLYCSKI